MSRHRSPAAMVCIVLGVMLGVLSLRFLAHREFVNDAIRAGSRSVGDLVNGVALDISRERKCRRIGVSPDGLSVVLSTRDDWRLLTERRGFSSCLATIENLRDITLNRQPQGPNIGILSRDQLSVSLTVEMLSNADVNSLALATTAPAIANNDGICVVQVGSPLIISNIASIEAAIWEWPSTTSHRIYILRRIDNTWVVCAMHVIGYS